MWRKYFLPARVMLLLAAVLCAPVASAAEVPKQVLGDISPGQFSRDGKLLITGAARRAIIWDLESGKQLRSLDGHISTIHVVAFSPDGKLAVTGAGASFSEQTHTHEDATTRGWSVSDGKQLWRFAHTYEACQAMFSPDGMKVLTVDFGGFAAVLEAESGKKLFSFHARGPGHIDEYYLDLFSPASFSPDGSRIVATEIRKDDGFCVVILDADTGRDLRVLRTGDPLLRTAIFSPDGRCVVTASWDKTARIWDVRSGKQLQIFRGHQDFVNSAEASADGTTVVTASNDGTVRLWDVATGGEVHRWNCGKPKSFVDYAIFSTDGSRIFARYRTVKRVNGVNEPPYPRIAILWETKSGREVERFPLGEKGTALISAAGKLLLTQAKGDIARLWSTKTGTLVREYK